MVMDGLPNLRAPSNENALTTCFNNRRMVDHAAARGAQKNPAPFGTVERWTHHLLD